MPLRTVSNTGGNWNATTTWVGGVVPLNADTVDFTATSGNLVVNVSTANLTGIDFTNYVGIITFNQPINTNGTINLGTGLFIQEGTSGLNINGSSTISGTTIFNNISITFGTTTLSNDLNVLTLTLNGNNNPTLQSNKINIIGNLQIDGTNTISGTAEIVLLGNVTWSNSSNAELRNNVTINSAGTIKLGTNVYYGVGTLKHLSGKINAKNSTFNISSNATLINCHKINFNNIKINQGSTITMNEFFSGSPSLVTNISSTGTTANYTITFQNGFEKIAKFVNIINCTVTRPLQLLVLTKSKRNSTNRGIRYINQSPNGIAKGEPSVNLTTFGACGLLPDPTNL